MEAEHRKQYLAGAALTLAMAAFIAAVLSLLGHSNRRDLFLADAADERFGWRYEVLADGRAQAYEPEFEPDGITPQLPEGTGAVRITRTMTEDVPGAELEWMGGAYGVEVYLDGERLYSDFPQLEREADGFLHPAGEDWARLRQGAGESLQRAHVPLPEDYLGLVLSVTTYFPEGEDAPEPVYPKLDDPESDMADAVTFSVRYEVFMTAYAILALAIAGMFLLDIRNGGADWKILLLCVYFLMLFLEEASGGYAGYYSGLAARMDLRFLYGLHLAPLYLYLALRLKGWWKWPLAGGVAAWALYEGVSRYLWFRNDTVGTADVIGPGALVVFLAVAAAFCVEGLRHGGSAQLGQRRKRYVLVTAVVAAVYVLDRARVWGGLDVYLQDGIWGEIRVGSYGTLMSLLTSVTAAVTIIVVVSEIVRRSLRTLRTVDVLRERERMTLEGYERMLKAQEAVNAAYHEMRHHMTALSGILDSGDVERASSYVAAVSDELDQIPAGQYSRNLLVNVIAGTWLDRAMAEGVRVEHMMPVPQKLAIADEDLSVLLNNMLQNALEACRRMEPGADRYIRVEMSVVKQFLFVKCVNSAPAPGENGEQAIEKHRPGHGYGLTAMRKVAKKYGGMLTVEQNGGVFSVKTSLSLATGPER